MIEREKKYELLYLPDNVNEPIQIQQGYLMFEDSKHLRVRIINDEFGFITFKDIINETEREEYEFEIEVENARVLFNKSKYKLTKTRYTTTHNNNHVDIDFLPNGKKVVEIEFGENGIGEKPPYCGEEVTLNKEYSNIYIAKNF